MLNRVLDGLNEIDSLSHTLAAFASLGEIIFLAEFGKIYFGKP